MDFVSSEAPLARIARFARFALIPGLGLVPSILSACATRTTTCSVLYL